MAVSFLRDAQNEDGGFGARLGSPSEVEPTALAALALDDAAARSWLIGQQRGDGGFGLSSTSVVHEATTGFAALALDPGPERELALDRLERSRAERHPSSDAIPIDTNAVGWSWTTGTASWTEPTARALLTFRVLRPQAPGIDDAVALLRDRESVGGGWNYGNRIVLDEELPPFAQTTATAMIGLLAFDQELERRGLRRLRALWREESAGGLNLATSVVAFRVHGDAKEAEAAERLLVRLVSETRLRDDGVAMAWAALASSGAWESWS